MSAQWPSAVSTSANLFTTVNLLQTTLSVPLTASTPSVITLASTTGFPTAGAVTIDNEVIFYTNISGSTLTGLTRGADGTTAASHSVGVPVGATVIANHINALTAEVIAIETDLHTRFGFGSTDITFGNLTATTALYLDSGKVVKSSTTTPTELAGLHALTASRALATDGSGILTPSAVTATELGYLSGVTSAVQTQLNNILSFVSVKNYGAIGNGIANDTTAINNALASGYNIYFPTGTYLTTGSHTITTQYVAGLGKGDVTIKRSSGTNPIFTMTGAGRIEGMTLDGNSLGGSALIFSACQKGSARNVLMKNVAGTSYAMQVVSTSLYLAFEDLEFSSNYGHIYLNAAYYSNFFRTKMFGATNSAFAIEFALAVTDVSFDDLYMESCIDMTTTSIRDIHFNNVRVRLDSIPGAWLQATYSPGSEVANVTITHASFFKAVANTTLPLFDVSIYQLYMKDIHIYDSASGAGWCVVRDRGTRDFRMEDWEIESANSWLLFHASSSGGSFTYADHVSYTQGVVGSAVWSSEVTPGGVGPSSYITVRRSNLNHSIASTHVKGGYIFEQIQGDLDLTNAIGPVQIWNVSGTVTDPNYAAVVSQDGRLRNIAGTVGSPTYSWASSPTTGMYLFSTDRIAWSIAGSKVVDLLSSSFGTTLPFYSTAASSSALEATTAYSGGIVGVHVENTSNTANSSANVTARVDGTSAGDPYFTAQIDSGSSWSWGADNSDSDTWKLCLATTLGSGDTITVTTDGSLGVTATSNQLVLGATRTVTVTAPTPATSSRTWTIPDLATSPTFAALEGTQTFSGTKTFSAVTTSFTAARTDTQGNCPVLFSTAQKYGFRIDTGNLFNIDSHNGSTWSTPVTISGTGVATFSGQLVGKGTAAADAAASGYIGEEIESKVSAFTSVGTSAQYSDLTSITLTAGDWMLSGAVVYQRNGATFSSTDLELGISSTTGNSATGLTVGYNYLYNVDSVPTTFTDFVMVVPPFRVSISSTTVYYLKGYVAAYSVATPKFAGSIVARRMR